jgi:hypothetical protein
LQEFTVMVIRFVLGIFLALLMFGLGLAGAWYFPDFKRTGGIPCGDAYCIDHFQHTLSSDLDAVTLFHSCESSENSRTTFESNAANGNLIERSLRLDGSGKQIGERIVVVSPVNARICWTDGAEFWFIDAPDLRIARRFEESSALKDTVNLHRHLRGLD